MILRPPLAPVMLPFGERPLYVGSGGGVVDPLARFKAALLSGTPGTVYADGDSNTLVANEFWSIINGDVITPGGEWAGWSVINGGQNGQTLEGQLAGTGMNAIYASNAKFLLACWLTNDARLGARTVAQMTADLLTYIARVKANLPGCDILIWTPNSWQLTDPQGYGYVNPLSSAQLFNDNMWQACENVRLTAPPNVAFVDKMATTGKVLVPVNPMNQDILHWNNVGQRACANVMLPVTIPPKPPINLVASAAAWASNPNDPWTVYPRALEDTRYCNEIRGLSITTQGPGYAYWFPRWTSPAAVAPGFAVAGDFIKLPQGVYTVTGGEGQADAGGGVNMYGINAANFPPTTVPSNCIQYRKKP